MSAEKNEQYPWPKKSIPTIACLNCGLPLFEPVRDGIFQPCPSCDFPSFAIYDEDIVDDGDDFPS